MATSGKLNAGYLAAGSLRLPALDPIQVQTGIGFGFGETKLLDAASLTQASRHLDVEINGDRHVLFTQPYLLRPVTTGPAAGRIVAVRQANVLATAFHPELTGDLRVHRYFVDIVRDALPVVGRAEG